MYVLNLIHAMVSIHIDEVRMVLFHIDEVSVALGLASMLGTVLWHYMMVQQVVTVALDE